MSRHERPDEPASGYEDPAQLPGSKVPPPRPDAERDAEERSGRWPARTLFFAVVVVLLVGLAILVTLGYIASR